MSRALAYAIRPESAEAGGDAELQRPARLEALSRQALFDVYTPLTGWARADGTLLSDEEGRRPGDRGEMKRRSSLDDGFDRYLHRQLHEIFDPVLEEAIPDKLLEILERLDEKPDEPAEKKED